MRLIEADAFAAEMKKRQDACQERIDNPNENAFWTDREHWYGVMATFSEVKLTLYAMPTVYEWVSVKDRLPEKEGRYLVLTSGIFGIKIAMFTMSLKRHFDYMFEDGEPDRPGFYDWDSEDDWIEDGVTHWMPLPSTEGLDEA